MNKITSILKNVELNFDEMETKQIIDQNNKIKIRQIQNHSDAVDDNLTKIKQTYTRNGRSIKSNIVPTTIAIIALD